jgi:shikimate kinase
MNPNPYFEPHSPVQLKQSQHISLIGFSGSQVHQVAAFLSSMTGITLIEVDQWVSHRAGCSVAQLYLEQGEEAWRTLEAKCLQEIFISRPYAIICLNERSLNSKSNIKLCCDHSHLFHVRRSAKNLFKYIIQGLKSNPRRFPYWIHCAPTCTRDVQEQLEPLQKCYENAQSFIEANDLSSLAIALKILKRL